MPNIEFSDEEHAAVAATVRRAINEDKYPLSSRLAPLKAALAKLDPRSAPQPGSTRVLLPQAGPIHGNRGSRRARP
jgi:hypothetical protein